jgi:hypothetical protein
LIEVMVAMGILTGALGVVLEVNARNVAATLHSRMMTTATLLARARMVRIDDELDEQGFPEQSDLRSGDFKEDGFADYRWEARIEKIELPGDLAQQAQKAAEGKQAEDIADKVGANAGGFNAAQSGLSGSASMIFGQFDIIRTAIETSIRRVTLRVYWVEGRAEKFLEVTTFITDASKVDQAIPGLGLLGALGGAGTSGATGGAGAGGPRTTPNQQGGATVGGAGQGGFRSF